MVVALRVASTPNAKECTTWVGFDCFPLFFIFPQSKSSCLRLPYSNRVKSFNRHQHLPNPYVLTWTVYLLKPREKCM